MKNKLGLQEFEDCCYSSTHASMNMIVDMTWRVRLVQTDIFFLLQPMVYENGLQ